MVGSIAKRIAAASASGSGNFFKPGFLGVVEVLELKAKDIKTKKRPSPHLAAIAEFKVVDGNGVHPNGTTVSIVEEIDEGAAYPDAALGRVKALVLALCEVRESEITAEALEEQVDLAFGDGNPQKGTQIKIETFAKTREGKEPITKIRFSGVADKDTPAPSVA